MGVTWRPVRWYSKYIQAHPQNKKTRRRSSDLNPRWGVCNVVGCPRGRGPSLTGVAEAPWGILGTLEEYYVAYLLGSPSLKDFHDKGLQMLLELNQLDMASHVFPVPLLSGKRKVVRKELQMLFEPRSGNRETLQSKPWTPSMDP